MWFSMFETHLRKQAVSIDINGCSKILITKQARIRAYQIGKDYVTVHAAFGAGNFFTPLLKKTSPHYVTGGRIMNHKLKNKLMDKIINYRKDCPSAAHVNKFWTEGSSNMGKNGNQLDM